MNKEITQGKWKQLRGAVKQLWGYSLTQQTLQEALEAGLE